MPEEAKIKIVLDLDDANSQLSSFYGRMTGAPSIGPGGGGGGMRVPGGGGSRGGPGPAAAGLGFARMGIGKLGAIGAGVAGAAAFGRTAIGDATTAVSILTKPIANKVSEVLFGSDFGPSAIGSQAALAQVKDAAALAVGYGADITEFQGMFDAIKERETRREKGNRALDEIPGMEDIELGGIVGTIGTILEKISVIARVAEIVEQRT